MTLRAPLSMSPSMAGKLLLAGKKAKKFGDCQCVNPACMQLHQGLYRGVWASGWMLSRLIARAAKGMRNSSISPCISRASDMSMQDGILSQKYRLQHNGA